MIFLCLSICSREGGGWFFPKYRRVPASELLSRWCRENAFLCETEERINASKEESVACRQAARLLSSSFSLSRARHLRFVASASFYRGKTVRPCSDSESSFRSNEPRDRLENGYPVLLFWACSPPLRTFRWWKYRGRGSPLLWRRPAACPCAQCSLNFAKREKVR